MTAHILLILFVIIAAAVLGWALAGKEWIIAFLYGCTIVLMVGAFGIARWVG